MKGECFKTSCVGYRNSINNVGGNTGGDIIHMGEDYGVARNRLKENVPIVAVETGVAIDVWKSPRQKAKSGNYYDGHSIYGGMSRIEHDSGYITTYAHLDYVFIQEGDIVKQGDVIGYMGNTGLSSGKHLHFEISVNPNEYF